MVFLMEVFPAFGLLDLLVSRVGLSKQHVLLDGCVEENWLLADVADAAA